MKKQIKNYVIIGLVIAVLIALILVYSNTGSKDAIKIGYLGPLTGDVASIGLGQQKAIQLAVDEINSEGGINKRPVEVIFEDSKCDGNAAVDAANKLINIDGVSFIVGGQCSSETLSAAPLAEQNQVVMISPLSSNPGITYSGDYIFRVYPSDNYQGEFSAKYIKDELGYTNIAVMSCLDDWCKGIKDVFVREFENLGGNIVESQEFEKGSTDLRTQLTKVKQSNPELIFMISYTDSAVTAFRQAKELGIETKFFGGDAWGETTLWERSQEYNEDNAYSVPISHDSAEFTSNFASKFGAEEEIVLAATNNYDAIMILKKAIESVGDDPTRVKDYLYTMPKYNGYSGIISFDENGDLISAEYGVMKSLNGEIVSA